MSSKNNPGASGSESFAEMFGKTDGALAELPKRNQLVTGHITALTDREILIDLGAKSEGIVNGKEIEALPKDYRQSLKVGDEIFAYVVLPEDTNGNVVLSIAKAVNERDWRSVEEMFNKQEAVESMVAGFNKGGLIIKIGRLRGFVPASQLSMQHQRISGDESLPAEQRYQKLVGRKTMVKVIEVDRERNRLILSERAANKEMRALQREKFMTDVKVGDVLEGDVIGVKDFGVFVDLGSTDGMVHLSEVSHLRIKHPSEAVKEGDHVKVKVIGVDRDGGRVQLSIKSMQDDPWMELDKRYKPGQLIEAEIVKTHPKHGAFARIKGDESIEGLIPLSELSDKQVASPREVVKEGQQVVLRVLRVEPDQKRIALSLRRVSWSEYADGDWGSEVPLQ